MTTLQSYMDVLPDVRGKVIFPAAPLHDPQDYQPTPVQILPLLFHMCSSQCIVGGDFFLLSRPRSILARKSIFFQNSLVNYSF